MAKNRGPSLSEQRLNYAMYYSAMCAMAPEMLAELETWERENLTGDGVVRTSDWPGWVSLIGSSPWHNRKTARAGKRS